MKWVVLFGGEPLQERHTNSVTQAIEMARARGHEVVAFSNLAMIGERLMRALQDHSREVSWIETTVDGPPEIHDRLRSLPHAYQRTDAAIQRLLDAGIAITVRTNIAPGNIESLPRLAEHFDGRGWYANPSFKHIVSLCTDRHLQGGDVYREDVGYSRFLALKDQHPAMRHIRDYNIVYVLYHLAVALRMREVIDGVDYRTDLRPVVIHCPTGAGSELVFTGEPEGHEDTGYSIYCCAECSSNLEAGKPFRIGTFQNGLEFFPEQAAHWGGRDYLFTERSIRTVPECVDCRAALFCGGACSLESINRHGTAMIPECRHAIDIVEGFLTRENARLYGIGHEVLRAA